MKRSLASHGQGGRKKFFSLLTAALCLLLLTACAKEPGAARSATPKAADVQSDNGRSEAKKELQGSVIVGEKRFAVVFYDNETTRALLKKLPLQLTMNELNGNEKYFRLPQALPVEATETPETIRAGELMCWSTDTLVLFYATYKNSYGGYVKLGRIANVDGLNDAVGKGTVQVRFEVD